MRDMSRRKRVIFIAVLALFIAFVIFSIIFALNKKNTNQFGDYIKIQNYDQKIKNISSDVKDAIQTSLYNIVKKNSADSFDPSTVKDAYIRDSSDTQTYDASKQLYSGSFIVDIASIKQSYQTQYSYSMSNTIDTGGSPVVLSCLPENELKYGPFSCKDSFMQQANSNDIILQYLPYQNFSFKITPNTTAKDGHLVLVVTLTIADSDLTGDASSRAQVVALHKKEVTDWISSKGADPSKYTITYNYTDSGDYIPPSTGD